MSQSELNKRLEAGLALLTANVATVNDSQREQLIHFLELLIKWNKAYNLTAVRDPELMVSHHLLDSLTVQPHLFGKSMADIGTGAGLPGMPLAILNPEREFLLIDSNGKKTRFITHAVASLGLKNVTVWHGRSEHYEAGPGFDTVMCRALANMPKLLEIGGHLLSEGGRLVAQKGLVPEEELKQLPEGWSSESFPVKVPFLEDKARHIIVLHHQP
ncbi:MAG: 16S rRNA (guanine(527)-N(7))-methyltransferase RsmG [Gammaproteobacteria bacterium]